jgi:hypothetical protein
MKRIRFGTMFALSLLLGLCLLNTGTVRAQNPRDDANQEQPEQRPDTKQDEKSPKQDQAKPNDKKENPAQGEEKPAKPKDDKSMQQGKPAVQGGKGAGGARIPDDKFRASFGRQHTFVIKQVTTVAQGQRQFQYSGYTFTIVDPWPAGWAYTDDCYIDYIDGEYFLFDLAHPGVQLALVVVM